jgi:uncharacterized protein involved in response to NO
MVGFLFTAGRNWTNQPTPTGPTLAALAALWVAARVLVLTPFATAAAAVNIAFPMAAAIALAIPFVRAGNRRNYFFVALLVLLSVAAGAFHLSHLRSAEMSAWPLRVALDVILFIVCVVAGRVIPLFTNSGAPGAGASRHPLVEKFALGLVLALMAADAIGLAAMAVAAVAAGGFVAHAWRWVLWKPWRTARVPLLWVLHLAYAWVPIHFALRALAEAGMASSSAATHALTVGAAGGLIIGMMTRTARGHTARALRADRWDVACYVLVLLAAVVRIAPPLVAPTLLVEAVLCSAALWSAGFGLYAVRYWPVLSRPRLDGRPG